MATNFLTFQPNGIRACVASGHRKPDATPRRTSSSNWWTPLFGWSSEPDYINSGSKPDLQVKVERRPETDLDRRPARSRFAPGCFTEEKARQLRMMTKEAESFHDAMYHSAIASRLAMDFKNRSDL